MTRLLQFVRDQRGVSAAEFGLVLPLLLFMLFGIIDAGRFIWEYNRAEKATQMGARYAVVTDMVPSGLTTYSFAVSDGVLAGTPVPLANFTTAVCGTSSCTCTGGGVCGAVGYDTAAFGRIVTRMHAMDPRIANANVTVEYRNVGLGYAGDPNGPDVAPLVTVRLTGMTFQPLTGMLFGAAMAMPDFATSLTLEDGSGTVAN
jgi:Flp pilus assembly protein TadG